MSARPIRTAMPRDGIPTPFQQGTETVGHTVARRPPRRAGSPNPEDVASAKWFDAGVSAYGKADAYAEALGVGKADVSIMRIGKISTALRRLLPMQKHAPSALAFCAEFLAGVELAECPDDVLSMVCPLLEAIGYVARPAKGMTRAQLAEGLLADLEAESMGRKLIEQSAEKRGVSGEGVGMALRNEGETE